MPTKKLNQTPYIKNKNNKYEISISALSITMEDGTSVETEISDLKQDIAEMKEEIKTIKANHISNYNLITSNCANLQEQIDSMSITKDMIIEQLGFEPMAKSEWKVFTGSTSLKQGLMGLVPPPTIDERTRYLCGDGTWKQMVVDLSDYIKRDDAIAMFLGKNDKAKSAYVSDEALNVPYEPKGNIWIKETINEE